MNVNDKESRFQLIIKSNLNEIQKVEKFTEKIANKINFTDEEKDSLAISITEIVSNAISHGNKKNRHKKVIINYELAPKSIIITVQDEGQGFDVNKVDDPLKPKNLLKESGRGIYIVRTLMDEVEFEFNKIGTLIRLVKKMKNN